jgi:hypothetical protein
MMKKMFILLVLILAFTGCTNATTEENDLKIEGVTTGIGSVDKSSFDKQKLTYEFTIGNRRSLIEDNSIKVVLTEWTKERLIEDKITQVRFNEESVLVKGYVIFDSKDLSKEDIMQQQSLIAGLKVMTKNGEEVFIKNDIHTE